MERKWERKFFWLVFGWRKGREKNWWDIGVFSPDLPKCVQLSGRNFFFFVIFFFFRRFFFSRYDFYFLINLNDCFFCHFFYVFCFIQTFFLSFYFFTSNQTKMGEIKILSIFLLFHSPTFPLFQSIRP